MKSIQDAKVETAFNHAFTFYKQNGRSVESQESCIQQIAQMTGFDRATSIEIQAPVLSILMYNDTMDIANQVIQQHLNIVTGIIRGRLLDINHSNVQSISQSLVPALKHLTPDEWSLGMHTTSLSGRKSKDTDGISNQAKGCFGYIKHNGSVSIDKLRLFTLRDSDLTEIDMVYFSNEMAPYSARFNYLDFSYNRINDSGISCLFKHAFVPTGTYAKHVISLNLSNNNLGDDSAIIISNAIANGQLTATRDIDVSGNKITQNGWESFAVAVKSVQAKSVTIKVAAADTLQGMKEFLTKGFKYYTQTHKVVATKEFQDELLGANTSACEKTKDNVLKAAKTAAFIKSLTNGNDWFILAAGAEAGAGALISPDTWTCLTKEIPGDIRDLLYNGE